jgi:hypothetical protein
MNDQVIENGGVNTAVPRYLGCVESWTAAQLADSANVPPTTLTTPSGACNVNP